MSAKLRSGQTINNGDIVGIMIHTYRNGEVSGGKIVVKGQVHKVYREGVRGHWRAQVYWEDKVKGFLYTGKDNWAYVRDLTLVSRANAKR